MYIHNGPKAVANCKSMLELSGALQYYQAYLHKLCIVSDAVPATLSVLRNGPNVL